MSRDPWEVRMARIMASIKGEPAPPERPRPVLAVSNQDDASAINAHRAGAFFAALKDARGTGMRSRVRCPELIEGEQAPPRQTRSRPSLRLVT